MVKNESGRIIRRNDSGRERDRIIGKSGRGRERRSIVGRNDRGRGWRDNVAIFCLAVTDIVIQRIHAANFYVWILGQIIGSVEFFGRITAFICTMIQKMLEWIHS